MKAKGIDINGNVKTFDVIDGYLDCSHNQLSSLELPVGVEYVHCYNNKLTSIIIRNKNMNKKDNIFSERNQIRMCNIIKRACELGFSIENTRFFNVFNYAQRFLITRIPPIKPKVKCIVNLSNDTFSIKWVDNDGFYICNEGTFSIFIEQIKEMYCKIKLKNDDLIYEVTEFNTEAIPVHIQVFYKDIIYN